MQTRRKSKDLAQSTKPTRQLRSTPTVTAGQQHFCEFEAPILSDDDIKTLASNPFAFLTKPIPQPQRIRTIDPVRVDPDRALPALAECDPEISALCSDQRLYPVQCYASDRDPTRIVAVVIGEYAVPWAQQHGPLDGGMWEQADGPFFLYDILWWRPTLFDEITTKGFCLDLSEFSPPTERDLEIARHANTCVLCAYDWQLAKQHMLAALTCRQ